MNPVTPSPIPGGKVLSRDLSLLHGLSVADRRNYIVLSAASDAQGRFYCQAPDIDVDAEGCGSLARKTLLVCYRHDDQEVGFIPGGISHGQRGDSLISTPPPSHPSAPSADKKQLFLHRDHRLLYIGLSSLETLVLHALVNLSDSHGRGRLGFAKLLEIIGPGMFENNLRFRHEDIVKTCADLFGKGRLEMYEVRGAYYYAALDAKQWAMDVIPESMFPPPPGKQVDYSLDSPEGLAWYQQRKQIRGEKTDRPKAKKSGKTGTTSKADVDYLSKRPDASFDDERSSAAVFAAQVLTGQIQCLPSVLFGVLDTLVESNFPGELKWFAGVAGKSAAEALREVTDSLRTTLGAEPLNN